MENALERIRQHTFEVRWRDGSGVRAKPKTCFLLPDIS
jgi:hypothetical protein